MLRDILEPSVRYAASRSYPAAAPRAAAAADAVLLALVQLDAVCDGACAQMLAHALTLTAHTSSDTTSSEVLAVRATGRRLFSQAGSCSLSPVALLRKQKQIFFRYFDFMYIIFNNTSNL